MASLKCFDRPTSADTALQRLNFIIALDRARDRDDRRAMFHSGGIVTSPPAWRPGDTVVMQPGPAEAATRKPKPGGQALGTRTLTIKLSDVPRLADSPTARAIEQMVRRRPEPKPRPTPILQMLLEQEHRIVTGRIQRERSKRPPAGSPNWILISDLQELATELERSAQELANRSPQDYGRVGESDPAIRLNLTGEQWFLLSTGLIQRLEAFQPHNYMGKPEAPESP